MKNLLLSLFLLAFLNVTAYSGTNQKTLYEQLISINKEWKRVSSEKYQENYIFKSDLDLIQKHLFLVIKNLKSKKVNLNRSQLKNRLDLLNELQIYAQKKVFPINLYHQKRTPYFIDYLGTHCAVGYLMQQSGNENLAIKISKNENYAYLREIKTNGVTKWAEENGFTLNELAWIQPTYGYDNTCHNLQNSTNGTVKEMINHTQHLVFSGEFTEVDGLPCSNLGQYDGNQLSCFGGGIEGKINEIKSDGSNLIVVGKLIKDGVTYPLARFFESNWEFIQIPGKQNVEGTSVYTQLITQQNMFNTVLYEIAISDSTNLNQEVWFYRGSLGWYKKMEVNGIIYEMERGTNYNIIYGGHFSNAFSYDDNTQNIETFTNCTNLINYDLQNNTFNNSISGNVSDTILHIYSKNQVIYFAGTCSGNLDNVCVTKYLNGIFQPLVLNQNLGENNGKMYVNRIEFQPNSNYLFLSGNFYFSEFFMGKNFAQLNIVNNQLYSFGSLNNTVNDFSFFQNRLILGGEFFGVNAYDQTDYNNLVTWDDYYLDIESVNIPTFSIYPNPASEKIIINGINQESTFKIIDLLGKIILEGKLNSNVQENQINIEKLGTQLYFLQISEGENNYTNQFYKD